MLIRNQITIVNRLLKSKNDVIKQECFADSGNNFVLIIHVEVIITFLKQFIQNTLFYARIKLDILIGRKGHQFGGHLGKGGYMEFHFRQALH